MSWSKQNSSFDVWEKTNNHDENPPRKTKTNDDPNEKEQDSHNGKHLDMNKELLKEGMGVKMMRHEFG